MTRLPDASRRRGQPIVMLALLGAAWIGARTMLWDFPVGPNTVRTQSPLVQATPLAQDAPMQLGRERKLVAASVSVSRHSSSGSAPRATRLAPMGDGPRQAQPAGTAWATGGPLPGLLDELGVEEKFAAPAAGVAVMPRPTARPAAATGKRWSVEGWFAWRSGSGIPRRAAGVPFRGGYGGTQGGALARFDLSEGGRRPQAFVRLTHAPDRPSQSDIALGLGLRPHDRLPLRVQAEARATRSAGRTSIAPVATLVSELPVQELPLGFRAEAYGQAGWVGGDFATGFVDGQVRADRKVASLGRVALRLGAGAWGGAQKFTARLDVGPAVALDLHDAGVPARVWVDYRFRVAGNARPDDGIAVTLSTGF